MPSFVGSIVLPAAAMLSVVVLAVGPGWVFRSLAIPALVISVLRALTVVTVDRTGVSVRYRWITERVGWQQMWPWSEVDGVYAADDGLTLVHRGGRSTSQPLPWQAWTARSTGVMTTFGQQVAAIAAAAGVPVIREKAPLWRPARAWRTAVAARPSNEATPMDVFRLGIAGHVDEPARASTPTAAPLTPPRSGTRTDGPGRPGLPSR